MLIFVEEFNEIKKRFIAIFSDGTITKLGLTNPKKGTYIDHKNKILRKKYIKRHLKDLQTNNYKRAGYLFYCTTQYAFKASFSSTND